MGERDLVRRDGRTMYGCFGGGLYGGEERRSLGCMPASGEGRGGEREAGTDGAQGSLSCTCPRVRNPVACPGRHSVREL